MSFDLGNIVGSIAKAVLPVGIDEPVAEPGGLSHEGTHQASLASQPSGPTAPIADHLSNFVAANGLHSSALEGHPVAREQPRSNMSDLAALAQAQMFN